jgi:hypothetical protein
VPAYGDGDYYSPESQLDSVEDTRQQDGKQLEPGIEVVLITMSEPDVVIRAVGRRYLLSLRQVPVPRAIVEHAEHPRGRGWQPPDDRVLDGSYPLPPLVVQELAKPETRPEHARPGLGAAPEFDDEPGPVPAKFIRTARRLNPGDDELLTCRPLPDGRGRCLAARKAHSGKARSQRCQGLPVNHPSRYYAVHQPTIAVRSAYRQQRRLRTSSSGGWGDVPTMQLVSLLCASGAEIGVAGRKSAVRDATAPHVTLRQAVRPVVVAHGILSSEQLAAGALAEEAKNLVDLTEELLRKLGRVHLLTASAAVADGPPKADTADRLVEAYANAGMWWARVLSSVTRLAEVLIDEGDWATAGLLAQVISEAGETAIAQHIEEVGFRAARAAIRTHLSMSAAEIREAVARLSALPRHPERESIIKSRRLHLAASALAVAQNSKIPAATNNLKDTCSRLNMLNQNPQFEILPNYQIPEESAFFAQVLATLDLCGV